MSGFDKDGFDKLDDDFSKFGTEDDGILPIDKQKPRRRRDHLEGIPDDPGFAASFAEERRLPKREYSEEEILVKKGDNIDLLQRDPTLREIHIGAGWERRQFDEKRVDIDLSCFLLGKDDQTRIDEDFIFYNNETGCEGAVKHHGDSRTGAGEGDDEAIFIDLNGVPFDVMKILLVLSVYDPDYNEKTFDVVRDVFIRVSNHIDGVEIVRFPITEDCLTGNNALIPFILIREGAHWILDVQSLPVKGGLAKVAQDHGIIVKELHVY